MRRGSYQLQFNKVQFLQCDITGPIKICQLNKNYNSVCQLNKNPTQLPPHILLTEQKIKLKNQSQPPLTLSLISVIFHCFLANQTLFLAFPRFLFVFSPTKEIRNSSKQSEGGGYSLNTNQEAKSLSDCSKKDLEPEAFRTLFPKFRWSCFPITTTSRVAVALRWTQEWRRRACSGQVQQRQVLEQWKRRRNLTGEHVILQVHGEWGRKC